MGALLYFCSGVTGTRYFKISKRTRSDPRYLQTKVAPLPVFRSGTLVLKVPVRYLQNIARYSADISDPIHRQRGHLPNGHHVWYRIGYIGWYSADISDSIHRQWGAIILTVIMCLFVCIEYRIPDRIAPIPSAILWVSVSGLLEKKVPDFRSDTK